MVRLGKIFASTTLLGVVFLVAPHQARAQAPAPQTVPPQMTPSPRTAAPASAQPAKAHTRRKKSAKVEETPAPPPPPTLEQSPPTAPHVTMQNGQLTIDASNSTLGQVLRAVQSRTGAAVEIPSAAANERVVAQLGPGQPRDVLNTLLNGTKFNYVILGVNGDPGGVQRVILTPRQSGPATPVNTSQNVAQAQQEDEQVDEGVPVAESGDNEYQNPEPPPVTPGGLRRPMMMQGSQYDPGANNGGGEQPVSPKTPEQLMQEMQQLQQQQMMYQQQLNPANQQPQQ